MSRRRKKLTRSQSWFVLFAIAAFLVAGGISALISSLGGGFNPKLFIILFFVFLILFAAAGIVLSIPSVKGRIGEARVNGVLEELTKDYGGRFIHDVIVMGDDGKTSQIDHVYVCSKGVFVIETKNYAGRIYGSEEQKQWTQVLAYGNSKNKLYNPIMQNYTHIRRLKQALPWPVDMASVVVFVHGNIDYIDSDNVYDLKGLRKVVAYGTAGYSQSEVEEIANAIQFYKDNPVSTTKQHVQQIKETKKGVEQGICPRCGGKLVLRTSKKDGSKFYGCSNYPNCRFTKNI